MRLYIEVPGYDRKLLFASDENLGPIIQAIGRAQVIREVGPYNAPKLEVARDAKVEIRLLPDGAIELPEVENKDRDLVVQLSHELTELRSAKYKVEAELKKLKEAQSESTKDQA